MTARKSAENLPIPSIDPASRRPSWRAAPTGLRRKLEEQHRRATRDGGSHTTSFLNSVWANGYTCTLDGLTPNLDQLGNLEGAARWAKARDLRIGSTVIRAEEDARARYASKLASGWNEQARVDEQTVKRNAAEKREAATARLAAELLAATAAATELEARARARAQAELEVSRRGV